MEGVPNFSTRARDGYNSHLSTLFYFHPDQATSFPGGSVVKNPPANAGDMGLILQSGKFSGEGNGNPLQCSCLGNPVDRGAWWAAVHGVAKSQTGLDN